MPMGLIVEHINKSFGRFQVIKDLSMEVAEGALFGFLGANGAGKTTTMRMILDIIRPDAGQISWNGRNVQEVSRHSWGYLPEVASSGHKFACGVGSSGSLCREGETFYDEAGTRVW